VLCGSGSGSGGEAWGWHPRPVGSQARRTLARPWMGASLRRDTLDSLGMSRLPLPRFESRAVGVAVSGPERAELNNARGGDGMAVGPTGAGPDRG
jgi:hypothetical protein